MNYGIAFTPLVPTLVLWLAIGAIVVIAALLLLGSVAGAQVGVRFAAKVKPEYLRLALVVIVLLVAGRIALGLGWRPDELYSVELS